MLGRQILWCVVFFSLPGLFLTCCSDYEGKSECGNGVLEKGEQCDGADLGGAVCSSASTHTDGTLSCTLVCTLNTSQCYTCGNLTIEGPEVCDGVNLSGETCFTKSGWQHGTLSCMDDCLGFDTSNCHQCGNDALEGPEVCDGLNLAYETCASWAGHSQGQLRCGGDCLVFDSSGCYTCGDGRVGGQEVCDGTNLGGETCFTRTGKQQGVLACEGDCLGFDDSGCHTCGDGEIEGPEVCDGTNFGGETCFSQAGKPHGSLECNGDCLSIISAGCHTCGDGEIEAAEECDGTNLGGLSCEGLGYEGGNLRCSLDCVLDESWCCNWGGVDPCAGVACSGHGTCDVYACDPFCQCDAGYDPGPGLECIPEGTCSRLGKECMYSEECCGVSECLRNAGQDTGYCTIFNCVSTDDCYSYAGDHREMCCVDYGGGFQYCLKIDLGYECGDQTGQCGESCVGQGASACEPALYCRQEEEGDPEALCTRLCSSHHECLDCADPLDPNMVFTCQPVSSDYSACLPSQDEYCYSRHDCEAGQVCVAYPDDTVTMLYGQCAQLGALETGTECDDDVNPNDLPFGQRCVGFFCLYDHCTEVCSQDSDCPSNMVCGLVRFCMDSPTCDIIAGINMCLWYEGSLTPCAGNDDCPEHETCYYYVGSAQEVRKVCVAENCDPSGPNCTLPPDPCGQGLDPCWGNLCLNDGSNSFCSALCETDVDCPSGMTCGAVRVADTLTTGACLQ